MESPCRNCPDLHKDKNNDKCLSCRNRRALVGEVDPWSIGPNQITRSMAKSIIIYGDGMKSCSKCGGIKKLSDYCINKVSKDGRKAICKKCESRTRKRLRRGLKDR